MSIVEMNLLTKVSVDSILLKGFLRVFRNSPSKILILRSCIFNNEARFITDLEIQDFRGFTISTLVVEEARKLGIPEVKAQGIVKEAEQWALKEYQKVCRRVGLKLFQEIIHKPAFYVYMDLVLTQFEDYFEHQGIFFKEKKIMMLTGVRDELKVIYLYIARNLQMAINESRVKGSSVISPCNFAPLLQTYLVQKSNINVNMAIEKINDAFNETCGKIYELTNLERQRDQDIPNDILEPLVLHYFCDIFLTKIEQIYSSRSRKKSA